MSVKDNTAALQVILETLQAMAGGSSAAVTDSEPGETGQDSAG